MAGMFGNVPGYAGLKDAVRSFKSPVEPLDVLLGVGVGLVSGAVFKQFVDLKLTSVSVDSAGAVTKAPTLDPTKGIGKFVSQYAKSIGSAGAGLLLFAVQKGSRRGAGHLVGAVGAAVVPEVAAMISRKLIEAVPGLHGYVMDPYGRFGLIANDNAFGTHYVNAGPAMGMIANDGAFGLIANDSAFGTHYVNAGPAMGMAELRAVSQQIGENADEYMV